MLSRGVPDGGGRCGTGEQFLISEEGERRPTKQPLQSQLMSEHGKEGHTRDSARRPCGSQVAGRAGHGREPHRHSPGRGGIRKPCPPGSVSAGQPWLAAVQPVHPLPLVARPALDLPPRRTALPCSSAAWPRGSGREQIGGAVTADEAVELVASHLPLGCGPALDGTPDDLESLSRVE